MKKITVVTGHFGSGKTEFSINYAMHLKKTQDKVTIVDMDTVNPYFRTKDAQDALEKAGIRVIAPEFANTNVDIISMPGEVLSVFDEPDRVAVLDIGGDDEGAIVLGTYHQQILQSGYEMFFVFNAKRPDTAELTGALELFHAIEQTSRLSFTGIINNTNLMGETSAEILWEGQKKAEELARAVGVPVSMITGKREHLEGLSLDKNKFLELAFYIKQPF